MLEMRNSHNHMRANRGRGQTGLPPTSYSKGPKFEKRAFSVYNHTRIEIHSVLPPQMAHHVRGGGAAAKVRKYVIGDT